ncbi:MAG: hypothetical protein LBL62_12760 [Planctomycetaceae bacterium]|nr:hypothetical protein [Planctomycetaceae bacterium]
MVVKTHGIPLFSTKVGQIFKTILQNLVLTLKTETSVFNKPSFPDEKFFPADLLYIDLFVVILENRQKVASALAINESLSKE